MSDTFSTINDVNANTNKSLYVVKERDVEYKLDINDSIWKEGPLKFAQAPAWTKDGKLRPTTKRGLPGTYNNKWLQKSSPVKNFNISPSGDPYR